MMMVALVLHLWHIVAPGGKLGVSSSASEAVEPDGEAVALFPGVRREEDEVREADAPTLEFFFALAS